MQGDVVVAQGEAGDEMYFIGEGVMEVRIYQDIFDVCRPPCF
jgi:CRP-like cAMP-binding protein